MSDLLEAITFILMVSFISFLFFINDAPRGDHSLWVKAVELSSLWLDAQIQSYK